MTLLEFTDVSRCLRDGARELIVLDGVNFDVYAGDLVSVHGERRSGKSTFVKLAAGLEVADAGTVSFDGVDPPASRSMGVRGCAGVAVWPWRSATADH